MDGIPTLTELGWDRNDEVHGTFFTKVYSAWIP